MLSSSSSVSSFANLCSGRVSTLAFRHRCYEFKSHNHYLNLLLFG